ncbi:hypothetical protein BH09DEP1_BH09DEP1_0350 [soil metagenome]
MKQFVFLLVLIFANSQAMLSQMEMGQRQPRELSMKEACCDCACDPKFYLSAAGQTKVLGYFVDKAWDHLQQTDQTAFKPLVYASAVAFNAALIAGTGWYYYRQNKLKTKKD